MTSQDLLGIELPVLQAPMAGSQGSALAVAVSNAGGLGALPCAMLDAATLHAELSVIQQGTTHPYAVNFFCHTPPTENAAQEQAWLTTLAPYFDELAIDASALPVGVNRAPFDHAMADVLEDFKPPVVSFHFGLPDEPLLARVRAWGATVLASATTLAEALWLEARGVDAVIAQGWEAGGHRGMFLSDDLTRQPGTFALVPQLARRLTIPVIAAGGIADASGVRAAMALGAAAAQIGTTFLLCPEAKTSALHRAALQSEAAHHTAVTNLFTGRPARGIVNRVMRELGPMNAAVPAFPLAARPMTALRAQSERLGRADFSPLWAGQNVTGCQAVSAAELTRTLAGVG